MKIWKVILATLVIFGAGVVTGSLTVRLHPVAGNPPQAAPVPIWPQQRIEYLQRMQRQLDLTPDQRQKIELILSRSQERMRDLWEPIAPHAREESRHARTQILETLDLKQRRKFEAMFRARSPNKGLEPLRSRDRKHEKTNRLAGDAVLVSTNK